MSRNDNRLGAPQMPPIPQTNTTNSLLQYVAPTQFVELPSKGIPYPPEHPLCNKEAIEIKFMTAKDEDILSSQSLLKQGIAIDRFIENVVVDKNIKVSNMLIGDKNAILLSARISGYGNLYDTKVTCPNCSKIQEYSFDLNNAKRTNTVCSDDVRLNEKGNYVFTLPVSKISLEIRLLTGDDESLIIKRATKNKQQAEFSIIDQYKLMTVSANEVTDRTQINQFIELMPIRDSKKLLEVYKSVSPNVEIKDKFTCMSCGHEQELEVPFGADFLWPNR